VYAQLTSARRHGAANGGAARLFCALSQFVTWSSLSRDKWFFEKYGIDHFCLALYAMQCNAIPSIITTQFVKELHCAKIDKI